MFARPTGPVARAALTGGADALAGSAWWSGGRSGRCSRPRATDVARRWQKARRRRRRRHQARRHPDPGAQARRRGPVFTRSLDDITARVPEVVEVVRAAAGHRPDPRRRGDRARRGRPAAPVPGDRRSHAPVDATRGATGHPAVLLRPAAPRRRDSLIEAPGRERLDAARRGGARGARVRAAGHRLRRARRRRSSTEAVAAGQEGVVVKRLDAPYDAGRRGVGLGQGQAAAHPRPGRAGRRVGQRPARRAGCPTSTWARATRTTGGFVMLGKTFKGMTDEMLAWQTERFLELETSRERPRRARAARAGGGDRLRRRPALDPLPGRGGAAVRPGAALPRRQGGRTRRTRSTRCSESLGGRSADTERETSAIHVCKRELH